MPTSVIVAAAASTAGTYIAGTALAASAIASTSWITYAGIQAAASFTVGSLLSNALAPKQSAQQAVAAQQQRMQVLRSPVAVRQIVYGEVMTSGALVHAVAKNESGADYIWLVIACAGHEVESIGTFYLNDEAVGALDGSGLPTGGKFAGFAKFNAHLGATDQTADADLMAFDTNWTANHRLRGIAYVAVRLKYDQSVFPTGLPNVRFVVQGKKLYDPRTTLTAYSNNSALVAYDYLTNYYGASAAEIVSASFIAAANLCDEAVALAAGGTEARYTANGQILMDVPRRTAMQNINSSCGGLLTCPEGRFRYGVAAYTAPVASFDEDILRAPLKVRAAVSRSDLYNAVKGQFINPDAYWQAADFPALTNSTYAAQDGEQIFTDLQLPLTTSTTTAQRLAKIMLEKSRQGITVEMPCKIGAIVPVQNDNVSLTVAHLGWSARVFKVLKATLIQDGGVDLVLQEEASGCYDWSAEETSYDLAPDTDLPDPFTVGVPGDLQLAETLYETTGSVGVRSKAALSWTPPEDSFVVDYEVEYKLHSSGTWIEVFNVRGALYEFYDLAPGFYDFRVKARNILGVVSDYTPTSSFNIYGLLAAPGNVSGFSVKAMAGLALASWERTADLDVKIGGDVVLRWSPLTSGATWEGAVILPDGEMNGDATSATVSLATGTYFAKFIDSTGHYSDTAASFVATEALVSGWTTAATSTQHTAFSGAKTNTYAAGGVLKLDGIDLFDSAEMFDSADMFDNTDISPTGEYAFDATMDLGSVASRRFMAHIKALCYSTDDMFDADEMFDSASDLFDGAAINDCDATVYASVSDDDITYGAWTPFMVADFSCRYAKFKTRLESGSGTHNIDISELSVTAKEPI